jgi:hypothetical protein
MKAKKNGTPKEKKVKPERAPHPFGPPEARAKGYTFPSLNPTLFVTSKSVSTLPQNLQDVFAAIEKYKDGVSLKSLKVTGLATKTLAWLIRSLAKHEFIRAKAEDKPPKKPKVSKKAAAE